MKDSQAGNTLTDKTGRKKVLLCLLPFWTPLIPPQAIAQLKGFVEKHSSHAVRTADFNVIAEIKELYNKYFNTLKSYIPEDKRGNFYNMGHDELQNHMMAHFNHTDRKDYIELVKLAVYQNYFYTIEDEQAEILSSVLDEVYLIIQEHLVALMEKDRPEVIGFTAYVHTLPAIIYASKFIRQNYPEIKIIIGGGAFIWQLSIGTPDFEYFMERTKGCIDKVFVGTGQFLVLKYLNGELPEEQRLYTTKDIKEVLNYSNFVLPDMSGLEVDYYPYLAISGSTSCPNKCSFCSVSTYFGEYIKKDPKQAVAEISELKSKYKRQLFFMLDSVINPIITDLSKELLASGLSIYFDGYFRVDEETADVENTLLWRRAGFYRARIGVESGSQRTLDLMGKKITLDMSRNALASLAYAGIKTTTFWLIGHPGETEEDFQATLDFMEELKDYIYEAEFNPFYYFYTNQSNTEEWSDKAVPLYPEKYRDMVISQTWILDGEPSREVVFNRLNRFEQHRQKLGIPNPYTIEQINQADERWKRLHKNAAPPLVEAEYNMELNEKKNVKRLIAASDSHLEDTTFGF